MESSRAEGKLAPCAPCRMASGPPAMLYRCENLRFLRKTPLSILAFFGKSPQITGFNAIVLPAQGIL